MKHKKTKTPNAPNIIYLSTFISGLQKPVEKLLKENLNVLKIHLLLNGLVLYETNEDVKKIKNLRLWKVEKKKFWLLE